MKSIVLRQIRNYSTPIINNINYIAPIKDKNGNSIKQSYLRMYYCLPLPSINIEEIQKRMKKNEKNEKE